MMTRLGGEGGEDPDVGKPGNGDVAGDPPAGDEPAGNESAGDGEEGEPQDEVSALRAERDAERESRIRLEERLAARDAAAKPAEKPEAKHFTRAQLRAAVNEGRISEDDMEEQWARQQRELSRRDTEELLLSHKQKETVESRVDSEMDTYIASHPSLKNKGSESWQRVKREYDNLIALGDPHNRVTELKALRVVFGPADRVRDRTARRRETPSDTAGGSSGPPASRGGSDVLSKVPSKFRDYYRDRVDRGLMTLKEVEKDLPYMRRLA